MPALRQRGDTKVARAEAEEEASHGSGADSDKESGGAPTNQSEMEEECQDQDDEEEEGDSDGDNNSLSNNVQGHWAQVEVEEEGEAVHSSSSSEGVPAKNDDGEDHAEEEENTRGSGDSESASAPSENATTPNENDDAAQKKKKLADLAQKKKAKSWTDLYGQLILFFEVNGHSTVPVNHKNEDLREWAGEQRSNVQKLSVQQVNQLRILNFWPVPAKRGQSAPSVRRCGHAKCNYFAAFNGYCHSHFTVGSAAPATAAARPGSTIGTSVAAPPAPASKRKHVAAPPAPVAKRASGSAAAPPPATKSHTPSDKAEHLPPAPAAKRRGPETVFVSGVAGTVAAPLAPAAKRTPAASDHPPAKKPRTSPKKAEPLPKPVTKKTRHMNPAPEEDEPPIFEPEEDEPDPPPPMPDHPLVGLKKRANGNYDIVTKDEKSKNLPRDVVICRLNDYVRELSWRVCQSNKQKATLCTCMKFLEDKEFIVESVSHAILDYHLMPQMQRKHYSVERLRCADMAKREDHNSRDGPQRIFTLPMSYTYLEEHHMPSTNDEEDRGEEGGGASEQNENAKPTVNEEDSDAEDDDKEVDDREERKSEQNIDKQAIIGLAFKHRICSHAFHALHNIGISNREMLNKYVEGHIEVRQYKPLGRKATPQTSPGRWSEAYKSLRDMLNALIQEHSKGRKKQNADILLPTYISRRMMFRKFNRDRGWDPKEYPGAKSDTKYLPFDEWGVLPGFYRTADEAIAAGGEACDAVKRPVSWSLFNNFWRTEFPHLKTQGRVGNGQPCGDYDVETKKYRQKKKQDKSPTKKRKEENVIGVISY